MSDELKPVHRYAKVKVRLTSSQMAAVRCLAWLDLMPPDQWVATLIEREIERRRGATQREE
jgi:hypothetical protein